MYHQHLGWLGSSGSVRLEQLLKKHRCNEFTDELTNAHVPEFCLKRQSHDHILSERQFSCSLLAPVPHLMAKLAKPASFVLARSGEALQLGPAPPQPTVNFAEVVLLSAATERSRGQDYAWWSYHWNASTN